MPLDQIDIYEGLNGYRDFVGELLDWLSIERSEEEFDKKYGDDWLKNSDKPMKLSGAPISGDDYILGNLTQGMGIESWAGKLHVLQILWGRGAVKTRTKKGLVYYKTAEGVCR